MDTATSPKSDTENCLNQPIACLSDVDDISDIEGETVAAELHKTIASKPEYNTRRRSIFNTTLEITASGSDCSTASSAIDAYLKNVELERLNWTNFITQYDQMARDKAASAAGNDEEAYRPSEEQQAYLNQGPDLQNFIRGFGAFMNDGCLFMQQFEQMQELQEDLSDCCQYHLHKMQRNIVAESLAKIEKPK